MEPTKRTEHDTTPSRFDDRAANAKGRWIWRGEKRPTTAIAHYTKLKEGWALAYVSRWYMNEKTFANDLEGRRRWALRNGRGFRPNTKSRSLPFVGGRRWFALVRKAPFYSVIREIDWRSN